MDARRAIPKQDLSRNLSKEWTPSSEHDAQGPTEEFRRLLGPLVSSLMRDSEGALNLTMTPSKSFGDFKKFLQDQAALNDGMSFRNPYESLLKEEKYEPLLRALWDRRSESNTPLSPKNAEDLLKAFQSGCIGIDADRFISLQLSSGEGRQKLRGILRDHGHFDKDRRSDLVKAIAKAGKEEGMTIDMQVSAVTDQISTWNLFNLFVSDDEIAQATGAAEDILDSVDYFYKKTDRIRNKEIQKPGHISLLSEGHVGYRIGEEDFRRRGPNRPSRGNTPAPIFSLTVPIDETVSGGCKGSRHPQAHSAAGASVGNAIFPSASRVALFF